MKRNPNDFHFKLVDYEYLNLKKTQTELLNAFNLDIHNFIGTLIILESSFLTTKNERNLSQKFIEIEKSLNDYRIKNHLS